jgi:hypothetical protein
MCIEYKHTQRGTADRLFRLQAQIEAPKKVLTSVDTYASYYLLISGTEVGTLFTKYTQAHLRYLIQIYMYRHRGFNSERLRCCIVYIFCKSCSKKYRLVGRKIKTPKVLCSRARQGIRTRGIGYRGTQQQLTPWIN